MIVQVKYNAEIQENAINWTIHRLINQTYKLLPIREQKRDWQKPLQTIVEELAGMDQVLMGKHQILFPLLCKLQGLLSLTNDEDFGLYRRTIFECLSLMNSLKCPVYRT